MSETNGNGSNGNGNGANGWTKTVLVALATLAVGGGVGATVPRDPPPPPPPPPVITQAEVTALKVFEAETKLRMAGYDKNFEAIISRLDAIAAAQASGGKR